MKAPNVAKNKLLPTTCLEANGERRFLPLFRLCFYFEVLELELWCDKESLWRQTSGNTIVDVDGTVQQGSGAQLVAASPGSKLFRGRREKPDCIESGWWVV